jgi:hypothetical protein
MLCYFGIADDPSPLAIDKQALLELEIPPDAGLIDIPTPSRPQMAAQSAVAAAAIPAPVGALAGKVAYMNGGHGWTWGGTSWATQRPEYQNMVEDFGTQDQITFYANYLINAGATVVPIRPLGHQLNEVIVDNNDAGFSIQSGSWSTNTASSTYWSNANGTDTTNRYRFANVSATETAVARFTPTIAQAGFYPVYAWWNNGSNRPTDATYRINNGGGGSQEVKVNQRYTGKGWVYLGTYYFDAGSTGNVEVSNKATTGAAVIADAVRFGNGMGDWHGDDNVANPLSGKPREEELSLYWAYRSRGYTGSGAIVAASAADGGNSSDSTAGVGAPPRWSAYMNDETQGTNVERIFLSFHSNGTTGLPDASARGTVALTDNANPTPNQAWWANAIAEEVEEDMQALPAGVLENTWASRTNVLDGAYGEISSSSAGSEFSTTLLEVAFHDNLEDSELMRDPKVRDYVGRASYQATAKYFNNFAGTSATLLPDPPTASRATTNVAGDTIINWAAPGTGAANGGAGASTGYKIYYGSNGYSWSGSVSVGAVTSYTFTAGTLPTNAMTYFKVVATNAGGESLQRDVVAAKSQPNRKAAILIVNGFDRLERTGDDTESYSGGSVDRVRYRYQNTRDYVVQFAEAVEAYNPVLGVETVQNDQVISGTISLSNYYAVLWISGEESTADQTFSSTERSLLTTYLTSNGGKLFVSGAEIGWDLDQGAVDPTFYNTMLRADYVSDDAASYSTTGVAGSIFAGLTSIAFDNGADALPAGSFYTYDVETPDVIAISNGSTAALTYSTGGTAAVQYSSGSTRVVTMGFPFETITSSTKRNQVMSGVLTYFNANATTVPAATPPIPDLALGSDSGSSNTDNYTNDTTPTFNVTAEAGTISLRRDGIEIATQSSVTGTYSITPTAQVAGTYNMTVVVTNTIGNISAASPPLSVTIDTSAPAVSIPDLAAGSDLGQSSTDNITSDNTPTFTGTAETGAVVTLRNLTTDLGSVTAAGGAWSITSSALTDGTRAIHAIAVDLAGNTTTTGTISVTTDATAPTAALGNQTPNRTDTFLDFTVTYADVLSGPDSLTYDGNDITVTGPNAYSESATLQNIAGNVVTYRIPAPGGTWDAADSGSYTVTQAANEVNDIAGNARPAGSVGTIAADVPFAWIDSNVLHIQYITSGNTIAMTANGANLDLAQSPATSLSFDFNNFTSIQIDGTAGNDTLEFTGPVSEPITFNGGAGADLIHVLGGTYIFSADASATTANLSVLIDVGAAATFDASQHLASLTVNGAAELTAGGSKVIVTDNLAVGAAGQLNLSDNDIIWTYAAGSPIGAWNTTSYTGGHGLIASGANGGAWNGPGIVTNQPDALTFRTTLGIAEAGDVLSFGAGTTALFGSETVDTTTVLVKYTYAGDLNLDGVINADDYALIDFYSQSAAPATYSHGDINYDGSINADDYAVIDLMVMEQDGPM